MLHLLAQLTEQQAVETRATVWMSIATVVGVVLAIFQPIFVGLLTSIRSRLQKGDMKFEEHAKQLTQMDEKLNNVVANVSEMKNDLKEAGKETTNVKLEGLGTYGELRAEIERDFVRKRDFDKHCQRVEDQYAQVVLMLNDIRNRSNK